jgi:hypothetical protein
MTETDQQILPDLETLVVTYVCFVMQELPTDEAIIAWADGTLTMNTQTWSPANEF